MTAGESLTAVILAAGLGTRLRPLSRRVPKPLFPILNRPLLGLILTQLEAAGFKRVAINTHHQATAMAHFLASPGLPDLDIQVRYEPNILGTGGGLRNLADFLGHGPFLVINGDILTDLDFAGAYRQHRPEALATMILHDYPRFNNVWVDNAGLVQAFGAPPAAPLPSPPLAFTGIQVVSPYLWERIPPGVFVNIIDTYRQAIQDGAMVAAAVPPGFYWQDIGTPQDYLEIHRHLLAGEVPAIAAYYDRVTDPLIGVGVTLGPGVSLAGGVCLGTGVRLGAGVYLRNTVVWSEAVIDPGVHLENCVVGRGARVRQSATEECFEA